MTYELAKKLKDAGFPQKLDFKSLYWVDGVLYGVIPTDHFDVESMPLKCPTLSELIEACGDRFGYLVPLRGIDGNAKVNGWVAKDFMMNPLEGIEGKTPEEAVANLWLALHEKV